MIQKHELRIGNLLAYNDGSGPEIIRIKEVRERDFVAYLDDQIQRLTQYYNSAYVTPIPLTTEILEACGFTLDASYPIPLWQDKFGFYFSDAWFAEYPHYSLRLMNRFDLKIDCLHQLQNLYFALTGQELEVNLPANQTT